MGHIITDLKETFRRGNTFIRLIYINVGIFVIGTLISVILQLFNLSATGIFDLFSISFRESIYGDCMYWEASAEDCST